MDKQIKITKPGNVLILTHWSFKDALIQTYTLPYVAIIRKKLPKKYKIFLVTSEQANGAISGAELIAINQSWEGQNMQLIVHPYKKMGMGKLLSLSKDLFDLYSLVKKQKVKTIHAFCTPAGSIGYALAKITGATLIIDSYEPHAEAMVENNTWDKSGLPFKVLFALEKRQSQYAGGFVATSAGMKKYAEQRFEFEPKNFFVKPACVDLEKFDHTQKNTHLSDELDLHNKIVCVYAGKLGGIYLREEIFDFLFECFDHWGDRFRFLMLTNASKQEVEVEIKRTGLPMNVVIQRFVKHEDVPAYMSLGHFAINPVKPVPTKRYCTSIKDGEYWAMGLPVVITKDISDDSEIIEENNIGYELKELTKEEYQKAIFKIDELLNGDQQKLKEKIRGIAERYRSFAIAEQIYTTIYT
jgi:glycosyltransferase involved in cell wall biosynthesis